MPQFPGRFRVILAMAVLAVFAGEPAAQPPGKKPKPINRFANWIQEPPAESLVKLLVQTPEVSFSSYDFDSTTFIQEKIKKDPVAYLDLIRKARPDLNWLPFPSRDQWEMEPGEAQEFARIREKIRDLGPASANDKPRHASFLSLLPDLPAKDFWFLIRKEPQKTWDHPAGLRVFYQIFNMESRAHRLNLVEFVAGFQGRSATQVLLKLALFDLDREVRERARQALGKRDRGEVGRGLLAGIRHPWPPAAFHAARAMVELEMKDLVPKLRDLLDLPDPGEPFRKPGTKQYLVRELVRVNHHSGCLLCHPPSVNKKDPIRGMIPDPRESLASLSNRFYSGDDPGHMIRADWTFLRQDFSAILPDGYHPGIWSPFQRYDFLVRIRPLDDLEALILLESREKLARRESFPPKHQFAVISALRGLTGLEGGFSAEAWKQLLKKSR